MFAKLFTNVFTRFCFFSEKPSIFSIRSWYFRYKWSWFCSVCLSFESLGLFIAKSVSNPDRKKYDDYWEVRPNGEKTGSSGGKNKWKSQYSEK